MFNEDTYLAKQEARLRSAGVDKLDSVPVNSGNIIGFKVNDTVDYDDEVEIVEVVDDEVDYGGLEEFSEVEASRCAWINELDESQLKSMLNDFDEVDNTVVRAQIERNAEMLTLAAADRKLHSKEVVNEDSVIDDPEIVDFELK